MFVVCCFAIWQPSVSVAFDWVLYAFIVYFTKVVQMLKEIYSKFLNM